MIVLDGREEEELTRLSVEAHGTVRGHLHRVLLVPLDRGLDDGETLAEGDTEGLTELEGDTLGLTELLGLTDEEGDTEGETEDELPPPPSVYVA